MERMGDPAVDIGGRFTYRHYRTWPDDERWELIDGVAYAMSPAPGAAHQKVVLEIGLLLREFLRGKRCRVFIAPFDVLLPEGDEADDEVDTVVQPDALVYCDPSKHDERRGRGAPDLAVEVLSPSTSKKDQHEKFERYRRSGVREYWVLDPRGKWLCVYRLKPDGNFDSGELRESWDGTYERIESKVLEGFGFDPAKLFAED